MSTVVDISALGVKIDKAITDTLRVICVRIVNMISLVFGVVSPTSTSGEYPLIPI